MESFRYTVEELWARKGFFLQMCHETDNENHWNYKKITHIFDCLGQLPFDNTQAQERADLYQKLEKLQDKSRKIDQKHIVFWGEVHNIDIIYYHLKWQEIFLADEREKKAIKLKLEQQEQNRKRAQIKRMMFLAMSKKIILWGVSQFPLRMKAK